MTFITCTNKEEMGSCSQMLSPCLPVSAEIVRRTFLESCKEPADVMMEDVLLPKWLQIMINERTSTK